MSMGIKWDEFMPTAAIGAIAVLSAPLLIVGIPLYFIGRLTIRLFAAEQEERV